MEPHRSGGECNEEDACYFEPLETVLVVMFLVINLGSMACNRRPRLRMFKNVRLVRMFCNGAHVRLLRGISGHGSSITLNSVSPLQ